jgi:hypothetical protein
MITKFDPTKTYTTIKGRDVVIYNTNGGGRTPIHGAVKGKSKLGDDILVPTAWQANGMNYEEQYELVERRDLIIKSVWVNFYKSNNATRVTVHETRELAREMARSFGNVIAQIEHRFEVQEGDGLTNAA